jgi:methyl halide transferase
MAANAQTQLVVGMSSSGHDWEGVWVREEKPGFDMGAPHNALAAFVKAGRVPAGARCLVPGCGRGYDVALLAAQPGCFAVGWDLAPTGVRTAEAYLRTTGVTAYRIEQADFFTHPAEAFDFVYDYTFFCAIAPAMRPAWGARMAALVKPGGLLFCLQFPLGVYAGRADDDYATGPPFRLDTAFYDAVLCPAFELLESAPIDPALSPPRRAGHERVALYRRLP